MTWSNYRETTTKRQNDTESFHEYEKTQNKCKDAKRLQRHTESLLETKQLQKDVKPPQRHTKQVFWGTKRPQEDTKRHTAQSGSQRVPGFFSFPSVFCSRYEKQSSSLPLIVSNSLNSKLKLCFTLLSDDWFCFVGFYSHLAFFLLLLVLVLEVLFFEHSYDYLCLWIIYAVIPDPNDSHLMFSSST